MRHLFPQSLRGSRCPLSDERVVALAAAQKQPLLDSLSQFVGIESGSRDREGLDGLADLTVRRRREHAAWGAASGLQRGARGCGNVQKSLLREQPKAPLD